MNQKSFEDERHHEMFKIMPPYSLDLGAPIILIGCSTNLLPLYKTFVTFAETFHRKTSSDTSFCEKLP
jgi:hypothetical protein